MTQEEAVQSYGFGFHFDDRAWPLLYLRLPFNEVSDEALEHFIEQYTSFMQREESFATLVDSRGNQAVFNSHQRKRVAEWYGGIDYLDIERSLGVAVINSNAIIRGAVRAIAWVRPLPVPLRLFPSIAEAAPWIRERFEERNIAITPAVEGMLSARA